MSQHNFGMKSLAVLGLLLGGPALAQAPAPAARQPMDVEKLNDNIELHTGKTVSVAGEVEDLLGPRSFVLESGGIFDDEITVIIPQGLMGQQAPPREDADLVVTGTVRAMSVIEVERELGWDLSPELEVELEDVKHFLVADRIAPQRK